MAIDYRMIVGTKIDGTDIQQQIDKLPVKKIVVQPTVKGSKEIKTMTDDMGSLVTTTTQFNKVGESTGTTLSKVSTNFKDTSNQIKTASTHTETLAGKFVDITKKVVAFGAVTSLIGTFTKLMYEAVESVKVMDDSLTELKKVTDLSGGGLENYTDQAFAMARELKTTASDVTDAVTEFAKSNYTLEESQTLAKQAIIFQTIADGAVSASDSATMLIQVMKAYNMTVSDSEHIINAINEVSNKYALSSSDLSSSIGKVASSAKTAGVDFNSLLGLMTAGTEVTQNASKTANGLKSILVNLMSDKLSKQFEQFGISMRNSNGEMKDGYAILSELANAYNNMEHVADSTGESLITTNDNMNALLESLGGKYNINTLTAILGNFDNAVNATESAINSAGSATDEYAVAMDSIAKKTDALKGSFQELAWGDGGLQGLIKGFLDVGTGTLQFINKTDALNVILVATGVILGTNLIPKFMSFLSTMHTTIGVFALEVIQTKSLAEGFKYVGVTANLAKIAINGLVAILSIGALAYNKIKAEQEELNRLSEEQSDKLSKEAILIQEKVKKISDETTSREQLVEAIKSVNSAYDEEKSAQKDINDLRQEGIDLLSEEAKERANASLLQMVGSINEADMGLTGTGENFVTKGVAGINPADYFQYSFPQIYGDKSSFYGGNLEGTVSGLEAYGTALREMQSSSETSFSQQQEIQEELEKVSERYTELKTNLDAYNETKEKEAKLNAIINGTYNELYDEQGNLIGSTKDVISTTGTQLSALEDLAKSLGISTDELEANASAMGVSNQAYAEYASAMKDFNDSIDSIQSAYSTLSDAVSEYNETGSYSLDTVQSLLALDGDYLSMLQVVNGQMVLNEDAVRNKVIAQAEEAKQTIYNTAIEKLNALAHSEAGSSATDAGSKASSSAEGWETLSSATKKATMNALAYQIASSDKSKASAVGAIIKETEQQISLLDSAVAGMGSNFEGSMGKASKSASKASDSTSKLEKEANKLKSTVEDLLKERIQEDIDKLKDAQKDEIKSIESQISAVEKLKKAEEKRVEDKISALEKEKDSVSSYYDAEIAKLQQASTELDRNNKLMELQQNLALAQSSKVMVMDESGKFEYQADEGAVASAEEELYQYQQELALEQQIESLQAMKDTAIASLDAQISKWEEYKTRMSENYQSQIDSLNTYKQTVQDGYDEQIETLENYKDNVEEFVDTLSEAEQRQLENQLNTIKQTASNYETDLANLKEYINKYNAMLAKKGKAGSTVSTSTSVGAKKYASGTSGVSSNEVAFVGDAPNTEMVVGSKANGTLMNLAKGTGVVNAESTKTFARMLNSLSKNSSISGLTSEIANSSTSNSNASVVIQNVTLPSVTDPQSFMEWAQNYSSNMLQLSFGH